MEKQPYPPLPRTMYICVTLEERQMDGQTDAVGLKGTQWGEAQDWDRVGEVDGLRRHPLSGSYKAMVSTCRGVLP